MSSSLAAIHSWDSVRRTVAGGLALPLPGADAHLLMSPAPRPGWKPGRIPKGGRDSAALLLLFPRDGVPQVLLTKRSPDLPHHKGQISLPGGTKETGESLRETALREAQEEIGADPATITVLGELSPLYIPVSRFVLHPVVGVTESPSDWLPEPREVDRVLEVPLPVLADPAVRDTETRLILGMERQVPVFRVEGEAVWGATAMVLAELLWLLGAFPTCGGTRETP